VNDLNKPSFANLSGVLLAVFSFCFGPWMGSRSGLWILADLRRFLFGSGRPADVSRQQAIFVLLAVLAVLLLGMAVMAYTVARRARRVWPITEAGLAVVAVLVLGSLFFGYGARTSGVVLTALGCLVAGASSIVYAAGSTSAKAQAPGPQEPVDSMLDFQGQVAREFHRCERERASFTLCVIGVVHYEGYATLYPAEAQAMTRALLDDVRRSYPHSIVEPFSVGAVMVALPGVTVEQTDEMVERLAVRLRSHGFAGEMLLPGGEIQLAVGGADDRDGSHLGKLTEKALSAYSEAVAQMEHRCV
jgi:hypothetical protein